MCAPCRTSCVACCCRLSPDAQRKPTANKLRPVEKYRWFEHCVTDGCQKCQPDVAEEDCTCICRRNRHIIEALSYLFKCSIQYMISILFKLCYNQQNPVMRYPRDRAWDVMEHVKAPYTELNDLEIYDSMYDRCGLPIDPLDFDNIYKVVRMMFLTEVLTPEQQKYLLHMLQRLNANAHCPVHLDLLLQSLEGIDLKKLVCSLRNQEALIRNLYRSRQCSDICRLYRRVATIDKPTVKRDRNKRKGKKFKISTSEHVEETVVARQSALNRQFCNRKPSDSTDVNGSLNGNTGTSSTRNSKASGRTLSHSSARRAELRRSTK